VERWREQGCRRNGGIRKRRIEELRKKRHRKLPAFKFDLIYC
jgi:hypothetical protein